MSKKCTHCKETVDLRLENNKLTCPKCNKTVIEVYGNPNIVKKALKSFKEK